MVRPRTLTEQSVSSYPGSRHRYASPDSDVPDTRQPLVYEEEAGQNGGANHYITDNMEKGKLSGSSSSAGDHSAVDNYESAAEEGEEGESGGEGERAAWGGQLEFIFTCIGYAVGLGNVWRFPYLCYKNGGGAFLIPYILMLALVGLPLFFLELAFGQFASLGPITIWKINPLFKGLGLAMVSVSWLISCYYNVIISHVLLYLFASFASITTRLPWVSCDNWWNTPACIEHDYGGGLRDVNSTLSNMTTPDYWKSNLTTVGAVASKTPAEEYYDHFILEISAGIEHSDGLNWKLALCLLLAWLIVLICLIRGIQSLSKVVYFTALFPYVMLTILLVRGLTLPGASQGIIFYLKPDFSRLADPRVWSDAATQILYSLGACSGGLIAMSSYNKFNNNCLRDALIVSITNSATSLYAGFVIFSILGFMAAEKGVSVSEVATGGPGLVFVVYPEALSRMVAPQLWAILFFFMMATLGFGSQFSIVETVLSAITDEFPNVLHDRWASIIFRTCAIMFTFFMGLPMVSRGGIYLLNLVDYSVSGFPLLFVGLLEVVSLAWIYGYGRLAADIELMLGHKPNMYWKVAWVGIAPAIIILTIMLNVIFYKPPSYGDSYTYPGWAGFLGWMTGLFPLFLIVFTFAYRYCRGGGYELMRELMKPKPDWGPYSREDQTGIYNLDVSTQPMEFVDFSGRLYHPRTILLARTPAGSTFNVTKVSNYTGPVPVVLNLPPDRSGSRVLTASNTAASLQRQLSQSTSDLENSPEHRPSRGGGVEEGEEPRMRSQRARIASGSVPDMSRAHQEQGVHYTVSPLALTRPPTAPGGTKPPLPGGTGVVVKATSSRQLTSPARSSDV